MYKIGVPLFNSRVMRNGREAALAEVKRFDAERIFLALDAYELDADMRNTAIADLADNCRFFKENGYEVGAWIWAFMVRDNDRFRCMRSINGTEIGGFMCPSDEAFVEFAKGYIKDIANTGVDIIMFDDDFRYGFLSDSPGCLCDGHIAEINRIVGENLTREEIANHIKNGPKNKYRDAYLQANGDAFRSFAASCREVVDSVNPQIRMGACSCMTSWDIDGTDAYELATILAGNTKPFVRLIGAPYWAANNAWSNNLQDVIELERMEAAWTRQGDIEIFAECDAYARPRSFCPASYLEGFDTAIRVSGCTDGVLKYGMDYHSNVDYEKGYAVFHERNREIYKAIDEKFSNKTGCGVRIYESMKKVADMVMPTKVNGATNIEQLFFSKAAHSLVYNAIPTVYEGTGICGVVFDENARNIPLEALENGLIIDIAAAEILMERGIDVGIESIGGSTHQGKEERYLHNNNHIMAHESVIYDIKLKENAEILSDIETPLGTLPVSYRYENEKGQRFFVLNINTRGSDGLIRQYARSRQFADNVLWLSGKKLPAYVYGNPAFYIQCKEKENSLAVGLWNFFADIAVEPVVELNKEYREIEFINCNGRLEGDKVYLTDIAAFGFAGFEVK